MPCLRPIPALKHRSGKVTIKHRRQQDIAVPGEIELPCGTCGACRTVRIRDWAIRGYHESLTNTRPTRHGPVTNGCFVTLTYDEEHLPENGSLDLADWQAFMKALRQKNKQKIRFLACGEYGPQGGRPHLHACLYGIDFHEDRIRCETSTAKAESVEWISEHLTKTWKRGTATLGALSYATASYTAGYVLKKKTSDAHASEDVTYGPDASPLMSLKREFNTMSTKNGLGYDWFEKYWPDVYPKDSVEIEGKSFRPPRYYDVLLKKRDPAMHHEVTLAREQHVQERGLTPDLELRARGIIFEQKQHNRKQRGDLEHANASIRN